MRWQDNDTPRGAYYNWHRRIRKARRNVRQDGTPCGVYVWGGDFGIAAVGPCGKVRVSFGTGLLATIKGAHIGRIAAECIRAVE